MAPESEERAATAATAATGPHYQTETRLPGAATAATAVYRCPLEASAEAPPHPEARPTRVETGRASPTSVRYAPARLLGVNPQPDRPPLSADAAIRDVVKPDGPVQRIDVVTETGSTNADLLARHAAGEDIRGAVLLAEHQSAGRGRNGRSWSAPPRSQIALSIGVDAEGVPAEGWGWLPLLTGVALVDAVRESTGIEAGVKWPNDVLVGSGKLAGILAEVAAPDPIIVVGLGLNVTLTEQEAPDPRATSLQMLGAQMLDREVVLAALLRALATRIDRWRTAQGPDQALVDDYRQRSLTLGARVRALMPGDREITGAATDIDSVGRLNIDTGADVVTVSAGDITHLRPAE